MAVLGGGNPRSNSSDPGNDWHECVATVGELGAGDNPFALQQNPRTPKVNWCSTVTVLEFQIKELDFILFKGKGGGE